MSLKAFLAFPGDLSLPTGGYAYDRQVLAHLPDQGVEIQPLPLPAGFPFPGAADVTEALARLTAAARRGVLLVDGLALGALPQAGLRAIAGPLVALVHHPLALEEGLSTEHQANFAASERAALACCARVIATSPQTGRILVRDYGVRAETLTIAEPGTERAARVPADGSPPRLLAVGTLIPRKGYDVLVRALAQIADLDWTLNVIGSRDIDPLTASRLEAQIAEAGLGGRITLRGAATAEGLAAAYQASDLFVHPALFEGYGMALAEAMRRGLPILCTTGGAVKDTVPDAAGLKVPPGDADALAQALHRLLTETATRRAYADGAFAAGTLLPDWDQTAHRIASTLRAVQAQDQHA